MNINKLNLLLEKVSCDETCQREKEHTKLKEEMEAAQANILTAPEQLELAKKKYYISMYGHTKYMEIREKELEKEATEIVLQLQKLMNETQTKIRHQSMEMKFLQSSLDQSKLQGTNQTEMTPTEPDSVYVSNRTLFYTRDAFNTLRAYYNYAYYFYYILAVGILIILVGFRNQISKIQLVIFLVLVFTYPYFITPLLTVILSLFTYLKSFIPENILTQNVTMDNLRFQMTPSTTTQFAS